MELKSHRILLVDDEPGIRKILRLFLEMDGYSVYEAGSASQAKTMVGKEKPDLVIVDVLLPGETGYDVCEWIKTNPETKDTIVFIFTGQQDQDTRNSRLSGCDLYLEKPQNPRDIIEKVKEFLGKKKQG
jgi:DNA-binding response OmpR family regulator